MFKTALAALVLGFGLSGLAAAADTPSDPQIAHIAYTAGQIDIAAAEQAVRKSTNQAVIAFAKLMEEDHKAVNDQALALIGRLGVTPEDNATSQALNAAATARLAELEALDGAAFDTAYMANEVAYHRTVNDALAGLLIPAARDAELKALLETGLRLFTAHRQHAEMVAAELR